MIDGAASHASRSRRVAWHGIGGRRKPAFRREGQKGGEVQKTTEEDLHVNKAVEAVNIE